MIRNSTQAGSQYIQIWVLDKLKASNHNSALVSETSPYVAKSSQNIFSWTATIIWRTSNHETLVSTGLGIGVSDIS